MKSKRIKIKMEKGIPISPELIEQSRIRIKKEMKEFLKNMNTKKLTGIEAELLHEAIMKSAITKPTLKNRL